MQTVFSFWEVSVINSACCCNLKVRYILITKLSQYIWLESSLNWWSLLFNLLMPLAQWCAIIHAYTHKLQPKIIVMFQFHA